MYKVENSQAQEFVNAIFEGNDVPNELNRLPQAGIPLGIVKMEKKPWATRKENGEIDRQGNWVAVTFDDGGVLSLRGILQSPDITWDAECKTQSDRIMALGSAKLTYTYQESLVSKAGNPYKRTHFAKTTVGAAKK